MQETHTSESHIDDSHKLSPEELLRRKTELIAFYKEQTSFLIAQLEYERLRTEIEEIRLRRLTAVHRCAQIINPISPKDVSGSKVQVKEDTKKGS